MKSLKYIAGALVVLAIVGGYFYPKFPKLIGTSPAGSTFNTAKRASIAVNLANPGTNATSSSILNGDANDRFISSMDVGCENVGTSKTAYTGTGLAAITISVATSSTAAPASNGNANILGTTAMTLGTSTANFVSASSTASNGATAPGSALVSNIWQAGAYLTFTTNATNTAVCTYGVGYFGS